MSQEVLADKATVDRTLITKIETGDAVPSLETLVLTANTLEVSTDALLTDNLIVKQTPQSEEIIQLLHDCSPEETDVLINNMAALKTILKEYSIRK